MSIKEVSAFITQALTITITNLAVLIKIALCCGKPFKKISKKWITTKIPKNGSRKDEMYINKKI